jgi:hypothetical protein
MRNAKRPIFGRMPAAASQGAKQDHAKPKAEKVKAKWSARILRQGSLTGPAFIEFTFPTKGGGVSHFRTNHSDLRSRHLNQLLDQFSNYLPIFPSDVAPTDKAQGQFIQALVVKASDSIELLPEQTGFVDRDIFVTNSEILRSDGTRRPVPRPDGVERHTFVDTKGTLEGTTDLVLKLAKKSTYLAFGIGVALAAPPKLCEPAST